MKTIAALLVLSFAGAQAVELEAIPHRVIDDNRTYQRAATDKEISFWTTDTATAGKLVTRFGLKHEESLALGPGEVFAIFLTDRITEDLVQITRNRTANEIFADYADSGIQFKLRAPEDGKKYSHLTAVVFTLPEAPSRLGQRGMVEGLSQKE